MTKTNRHRVPWFSQRLHVMLRREGLVSGTTSVCIACTGGKGWPCGAASANAWRPMQRVR